MVEQDVVVACRCKDVALLNERGLQSFIGGILEVRTVEADERHEFRHRQGAFHAVDLEGEELKTVDEEA